MPRPYGFFLLFFKIFFTLPARICPWYLSSNVTIGPRAHAPRQFTVSRVKRPSAVVSPASTQSCRFNSSNTVEEPRTWQAVPRQTLNMCSPFGCKLNALKKVATPKTCIVKVLAGLLPLLRQLLEGNNTLIGYLEGLI